MAVALALAGCGGGEAVSPTLAAPAQAAPDEVVAFALAQQSVNARMAPPRAVALAAVSPATMSEDFESGMAGWSNWGNAQVVAGAGTSGSSALQVGTGAGGAAFRVSGLVPGTTYRLTAQLRVSDPSETLFVGFTMRTSSGSGAGSQAPVTSTGYVTVTVDVVASGSTFADVWVWKNAGTGYGYVDDIVFGPANGAPPPPPPPPPASGNLLSNGGFESGMTDWVNWGNASVVSGQASSGAGALSVGTAAGGAGQEVGGIVAGSTYRLTVQAKVSAVSETAYVGVNILDPSGAAVAQKLLRVTSTDYSTATFDVVAPANAVKAVVYVWKDAGTGFAFVDDFVFGAADGPAPPPPSANLVANGGFESGLASWVNWDNAGTSAAQAAAGSAAAQVGTGAGGFGQDVGGIIAGKTYRVSAVVKVSSPDEVGYLGVRFMDDAGTRLLEQAVAFSSAVYSPAQLDLTAPANATRALVYVWKNAGSGFAYVDEVALAQVTSASPAPVPVGSAPASAPRVAQLASGGHVVVWASGTADGAGAILAQLFDPSGTKVGTPVTVFSEGALPGVAALPDGSFLVSAGRRRAIAAGTFEAALFVQKVSSTGQLLASGGTSDPNVNGGLANMLISQSELDTIAFSGRSIYANADGSYVVEVTRVAHPAPLPDESLWFVNVASTGSLIGPPVQISDDRTGGDAQVTRLSGGNFLLAGASRNGAGPVWWEVLTSTGQVLAPLQYVSASLTTWEPQVTTLADGTGLLTFHDQNSVTGWAAARFDANGNVIGTPAPPPRAGIVTGLASGGWVQTWISGTQLMAQYFATSGQAVGDPFVIADNLGDSRVRPSYSVVRTSDGFVAAYCVSTAGGLRVDEIRFLAPSLN